MYHSYALRASAQVIAALDHIKEAGIHFITVPSSAIIVEGNCVLPMRFIEDRDGIHCTLACTSAVAKAAVLNGLAEYEETRVLIMNMAKYLEDHDVIARESEAAKAKASGESLVAVAVIGGPRGPSTVTRNLKNTPSIGERQAADLQEQARQAFNNNGRVCRRVLIEDQA